MSEAEVKPFAEVQSPAPAERKPWHAPTLTQVALQVTGVGSGQTQDNDGSSTLL